MAKDGYLRLSEAVQVVQRDVEEILGPDAVAFSDTPPFKSNLPRMAGFPDPDLWLYVDGEMGATGLDADHREPWPHLLARVADAVQQAIIESGRNWGAAFPPCPVHPGTPLWPNVTDGEAAWTCIDGADVRVVIGEWSEQSTS